jgi:N-acetylglutamate synthase-like GNAT family acetyltransferase
MESELQAKPGYLDPQSEPAKIRAFFIHPAHAREGVARSILSRCESEAKAQGFRALELMSTIRIAFYESCGFGRMGNYDPELTAGLKLELVPMRKEF